MNNAIYTFENPVNEPVCQYGPGSVERDKMLSELKRMADEQVEIPLIIGGKEIRTGKTVNIICPHDRSKSLGKYHLASVNEIRKACDAAIQAKKEWEEIPWTERGMIMLKAAELLSKKYRYVINAATMLGQSKNVFQAEIDSACEVIDFLRYNSYYASLIYQNQPKPGVGQINLLEYRPLEGFVFTVTPFNFTSIAGNLATAPALMGNTVILKPASTAVLSVYYIVKILEEAEVAAESRLKDRLPEITPGIGVNKRPDLEASSF